jgi:hypothetical protein
MTDHTPTPVSGPVAELLSAARAALLAAALEPRPQQRYVAAHIAALRAAAAILATRARRAGKGSSGPRSAWALLGRVAPELGEWAAFFAAGTSRRQVAELGAAELGATELGAAGAITTREADDLLRDAQTFLALVETTLGRHHQAPLPLRTVG